MCIQFLVILTYENFECCTITGSSQLETRIFSIDDLHFCCMRGCVAFVEGKYTYSCLGSTTSLLVEQFCMFLSYQLALGLITMVRNFAESLTLTIAQRLSCRPYSASTLLNLNISLQLGSYSAPALLDLIIAPGSLNLIVRPYSWTLIVHP